MLRTIATASRISVQGEFVSELDDGQVVVRVDQRLFVGRPVDGETREPPARRRPAAA